MPEPVTSTDASRARSRELWERAQRTEAGGVQGSNVRGPLGGWAHPIFMARGEGAYLVDVDGNRYLDYHAASGPLVLGHRPKRVIDAVSRAMNDMGSLLGFSNELEIQACESLVDAVPAWEQVRFINTGTEAVMLALRVARAYTGRTKILCFEGHFHGWSDFTYWTPDREQAKATPDSEILMPYAQSAGIVKLVGDALVLRRWNDPELLEQTFAEMGNELAAVICEPHPCPPAIPPKPGYLQLLRDLTKKHGIVLIFDEVKTGFRVALGGAQELFGVTPDISTAAKAMAAGFPVAAIGGRKDLFDAFTAGKVRMGSTYAASTVALAATIATLEELRQPGFYERTTRLGNLLTEGLTAAAHEAGIEAYGRNVGPMLELVFADHLVNDYRDYIRSNDTSNYLPFGKAALDRGIMFGMSGGHWFVSGAHTEDDINKTLDVAGEVLMDMAAAKRAGSAAR